MDEEQQIAAFLDGEAYAVVGASRDRAKYGNKVFRVYLQKGRTVYPVNPAAPKIEGHTAYASVGELPEKVHGISVITPPAVTERVVEEAAAAGVRHVWMQPGAESAAAVARCGELGMEVIAGGPCILVVLGFRDHE